MAGKARFQELYNEAFKQEESHIVPLYSEMVQLGKALLMGYTRVMHSSQVGVHWKNRDQAMCSGREALAIWDQVELTGVSPDLYRDATCIEEHGEMLSEQKFIQLTANDQYLREHTFGEIEASAIACSHWNQALAAADAGLVSRSCILTFRFHDRILCCNRPTNLHDATRICKCVRANL